MLLHIIFSPGLTVNDWSNNDGVGTIDKQTVSRTHFGGFGDDSPPDDDDGRKKSKAEVMKEVIAKSKFFKVYLFNLYPSHSS